MLRNIAVRAADREVDSERVRPLTHVIRLRGPWGVLGDRGDARTIRLPCSVERAGASAGERIMLQRRFARPTGLEDALALDLVVHTSPGAVLRRVQLNQSVFTLPPQANELRCDVRHVLESTNLLQVELQCGDNGQAQLLSAHLEIHERPSAH